MAPVDLFTLLSYLVAITDGTHLGSATASFKDLVTLHREYYSRYFGRGSTTVSFVDQHKCVFMILITFTSFFFFFFFFLGGGGGGGVGLRWIKK